jgi:hypothetical protein
VPNASDVQCTRRDGALTILLARREAPEKSSTLEEFLC